MGLVKKIQKDDVVFVFLTGHQEHDEGWIFEEPSWGIRIGGKIQGIFPGGNGKDEAISAANHYANKLDIKVLVV